MEERNRLGWWATIVVALFVIAPLASLASGANGGGPAFEGGYFTYADGNDDQVTLFIGPDMVPLATWEDKDDNLRLSRLSLTGPSKVGVVLSNLPRVAAEPIEGAVDIVAMDALGGLHVVWEDGTGGVWHKVYDGYGNVETNNHRLSAVDATASAPAVAATISKEGASAWVTWVEEREATGTHVRLVSIDHGGDVLTSSLVDGLLADLSPTACDVAVDLDGNPHVTFLGSAGAYWAFADDDGDFDLIIVHGPGEGTLPLVIAVPDGNPRALWASTSLVSAPLVDGTIGSVSNIPSAKGGATPPGIPRGADLATISAGGPLASMSSDPLIVLIFAENDGSLRSNDGRKLAVETGLRHTTIATDERGQTYIGASDFMSHTDSFDAFFRIEDRKADVTISSPHHVHPDTVIALNVGGELSVPIDIESIVGYASDVDFTVSTTSFSEFTATLEWEHLDIEGLTQQRNFVTLKALPTASHGSKATFFVGANPPGWPEAAVSLELNVEVPPYKPFAVRGPSERVTALPGETVEMLLTLESWSVTDETVFLVLEAPDGWTVEGPEESRLAAGESMDVTVEVTAPPNTAAGTVVDIQVTGRTASGEEGVGTIIPSVVNIHAGAEVILGSARTNVMPDGKASIEARIMNTGNEPISVDLSGQTSIEGWSAQVVPATVYLTPGSEAPALVWTNAPSDAPFLSECTVRVFASHGGGTLDHSSFTAIAGHNVDYDLAVMPTSSPLMDGWADFTLELVNDGNAPEALVLTFMGLPEGWDVRVTGGTGPYILSAGEVRQLDLFVNAPPNTPSGTVPLAIQLRGSDGPVNRWADIHVAQYFDAGIRIDATTRTLTPPGTVIFPFDMVNMGNAAGRVLLAAERVPVGWDYSFQTQDGEAAVSFPIDVGLFASAQLAIKVPTDAEGETHAIDLVARSDDGELLARLPIYVRLRFPDLAVVDLRIIPNDPREGSPLTVRARVLNLGVADAEGVNVVLRDGNRILDRDQLSIVPRLGELEVVLYMVPTSGRRTLSIEVDPADEIREISEANNLVKRRILVESAPEEPIVSPGVATAGVAAIITLSTLGLLGGTEGGKYALWGLLIIPLYTKIKKDKVLDHYLRGKIHGYIIANPGEHYNAIKEQLEITNGALSYHLRVLERESYVRSRMDGIFKRFYPSDMKLPTTQRNISSFQEVILTIVKNNQGLSQKDIAKRIGASSQVINYHIKIMEDASLIEVDRSRRKSRVYATDAPTSITPVE